MNKGCFTGNRVIFLSSFFIHCILYFTLPNKNYSCSGDCFAAGGSSNLCIDYRIVPAFFSFERKVGSCIANVLSLNTTHYLSHQKQLRKLEDDRGRKYLFFNRDSTMLTSVDLSSPASPGLEFSTAIHTYQLYSDCWEKTVFTYLSQEKFSFKDLHRLYRNYLSIVDDNNVSDAEAITRISYDLPELRKRMLSCLSSSGQAYSRVYQARQAIVSTTQRILEAPYAVYNWLKKSKESKKGDQIAGQMVVPSAEREAKQEEGTPPSIEAANVVSGVEQPIQGWFSRIWSTIRDNLMYMWRAITGLVVS
jgi:hypothetical protein